MASYVVTLNNVVKNLDDFQLNIDEIKLKSDEIIAIVGDKGAGKSTLIELIMGLRRADSGEIERNLSKEDKHPAAFKKEIGFVYEDLYFYDFGKLTDLSTVMRENYPTWDEAKFHRLSSELNLPIGQKFREFSPDMNMKAMLAASLSHSPKLLILDDITKHLERKARFDLFKLLRQEHKKNDMAIVIADDNVNAVDKFASEIVFLKDGETVFSGNTRQLKKHHKTLENAYKNKLGGEQDETADET